MQLDSKTYRNYLIYDRDKELLYAELYKTLYVSLTSSALFWNMMKNMKGWGFIIDTYDICVANKT